MCLWCMCGVCICVYACMCARLCLRMSMYVQMQVFLVVSSPNTFSLKQVNVHIKLCTELQVTHKKVS